MKVEKNSAGRKWIIEHSRGNRGRVVLLSTLCMISSLMGVFLALALKGVVDYAVAGNSEKFILASAGTAILILMQISIGYAIRYLDERSRADIENSLKDYVWMKIMTRDYGVLEKYHTGELMNRLSNDVKIVTDNIVTLIPSIVSMMTKFVCAMGILFLLDWRFTVIFLAGGLIVMGTGTIFRKKMKTLHKQMQEAEGQVRSFQQEMLENLIVIRAFQSEQRIDGLGKEYMDRHKEMRLKKNVFSNLTQTGFSILLNAGYLFGIIWCGFGIMNRTITYGTLLAVQQLVGQVQQPIAGMAGIIPRYYAMTASAERLIELEQLSPDFAEKKETSGEYDRADFEKLEICHLTTGYGRGKKNILENVNLSVYKGDSVAITGESGSGKSTLLKALLCLYPWTEGNIEIIGENGILEEKKENLRKYFAYVPQGNFLVSGTIRDIVSMYGREGCMPVEQACRVACADYIDRLPQKYDTMLGERGVGLSEGQMQRLAIARAVYLGEPVLLLDEATSALDAQTEVQVLKNLKKLPEKTILIVTHRPAALEICNRIFEVKDRKMTEKDKKT